jgi:hypothetical protein
LKLSSFTADRYPWLTGAFGAINYGVQHQYWMQTYSNNARKLNRMAMPPSVGGTSAPSNWSVSIPVVSDSIVYANLKSKASELKADVLLNVLEANQIWPSLRTLATSLPNMAQNWRKLTRRRLISTASANFLSWKFGIAPIIGDLTNIVKFAPDIKRQFDVFQRNGNKTYSQMIMGTASYSRGPENQVANGKNYLEHTFQGIPLMTPTVRYVLVVKPNVPRYLSDSISRLDFLMRRFTTSPAQLAWERIPFSFVADWFVDIRNVLGKIDDSIGVSPFEVVSFTKSTKWHLRTEQFSTLRTVCATQQTLDNIRLCSVEDKHYERSVLSPGFMPEWKPRYGKSQAGITAALIGQQLSRLRR